MEKKTKARLISLANRLAAVDPTKLGRIVDQLEQIVEARELVAAHDHLLFLRAGRPAKRYLA